MRLGLSSMASTATLRPWYLRIWRVQPGKRSETARGGSPAGKHSARPTCGWRTNGGYLDASRCGWCQKVMIRRGRLPQSVRNQSGQAAGCGLPSVASAPCRAEDSPTDRADRESRAVSGRHRHDRKIMRTEFEPKIRELTHRARIKRGSKTDCLCDSQGSVCRHRNRSKSFLPQMTTATSCAGAKQNWVARGVRRADRRRETEHRTDKPERTRPRNVLPGSADLSGNPG